ncbi:hypothetical protein [Brevibacterium sp. JSBI002]|uniref:hypothetical protein n=1 Tax=Brevibacterium sp. JSBI002 TaxID=2886045 RepID=UPI00222F907D|nr:hypothetical protein [Brevibacterium sp. JSBI002]UZD62502.1 hypothetical protein LJ362_01120 [Brevibacterium sp. JSBI002]
MRSTPLSRWLHRPHTASGPTSLGPTTEVPPDERNMYQLVRTDEGWKIAVLTPLEY